MNCSIWDKKKCRYIDIDNVKHVRSDLTGKYEYFEIDGKKYYTSEYELDFIHSEGDC